MPSGGGGLDEAVCFVFVAPGAEATATTATITAGQTVITLDDAAIHAAGQAAFDALSACCDLHPSGLGDALSAQAAAEPDLLESTPEQCGHGLRLGGLAHRTSQRLVSKPRS